MNVTLQTRHLQTILKALAQSKRKATNQADRDQYADCICQLFHQLVKTVPATGLSREQIATIEQRAQSTIDRVRQSAEAMNAREFDVDCETVLAHRGGYCYDLD